MPIRAGGRLTGKLGAFDVGALSIQTGGADDPDIESTNFSVLRLRRDVFQRSSVGALFTNRSRSTEAVGSSQTYGVDGSFSFLQDFSLVGYYAATHTPGLLGGDRNFLDRLSGHNRSYLGDFEYRGDLWGASLGHLFVGENFNPEVGFLRRRDFRETTASVRYSPRPESIESIRRLSFQAGIDYIEAGRGFVESREREASVQMELESSDVVQVSFTDSYEFLEESFRIPGGGGVTVPPGGYGFRDVTASLSLGLQRRASGNLSVQRGSFYTGDKTTVALRGGRLNVSNRLSLEPTLSFNWIDLPESSFRSDLAVTRVNYAFTPRMFLGGLVQYSSGSKSFSTNLRLRWEYRPGSELFIVYTESRDTAVLNGSSELENRGLTVKLNYLLRL